MKPVLLHNVHLMCVLLPGLKEGKALAIVPLNDLLIMQLLTKP